MGEYFMGNDENSNSTYQVQKPVELGLRITQVDGGYFIQNFDTTAGNAVRGNLDAVQAYVSALIINKFQTNAQTTQAADPQTEPQANPDNPPITA